MIIYIINLLFNYSINLLVFKTVTDAVHRVSEPKVTSENSPIYFNVKKGGLL